MRVSFLAFMSALIFAGTAAAQDTPAGNADTGKALFLADGCYECHGRFGEGGSYGPGAPILAKTMLPFDAFKQQLRDPSDAMPPYAQSVLPDQGVQDIYVFLQTLAGPKPVKDIAILNH